MKRLLALQEIAQLAVSLFCLYQLELQVHWGIWFLVFFSPDLGGLGYLFNPVVGAISYNLLHHKLLAIGIIAYGYFLNQPIITAVGILFYAHSSFDRAIGYGLKHMDSPGHTHLGYIGKEKYKNVA